MKKEINPAVAIGLVVVILAGVAVYYFNHMESPQMPSIRRGSLKAPSAGGGGNTGTGTTGNTGKSNAPGG
jgi:hypothetical protein